MASELEVVSEPEAFESELSSPHPATRNMATATTPANRTGVEPLTAKVLVVLCFLSLEYWRDQIGSHILFPDILDSSS
ncbi:MAG: hypothetical protein M5U31_01010 [Acidimicrobiia bacterium]|nr:hypothetical protein [Acidimicrobiia bacterium]